MSEIRFYKEDQNENLRLRTICRWLVDIMVILAMAFFVVRMTGNRVEVRGQSMDPTLQAGNVVLYDKIWYNFFSPERFQIIAFTLSDNEEDSRVYVKRIIGLPGETVQIVGGEVYIDGEKITLPVEFVGLFPGGLAEAPVTLGDDEFFLLGDNPSGSEDSRFTVVGNVPRSNILGKVWLRISPFKDIGPVH